MTDEITGLTKELVKKFGKDAIKMMSDIESEVHETVSTGSIRLDIALKEPLICGVHEFSGSEGAGKTTLALEAGASAQKKGMTFFYINMERGLHNSLPQGIKGLDREKMHVVRPDDGNQCLDMIENIIRSVPKAFIVLDSVTALVSDTELSKASDEDTMGMLGRMLSKFLKKMNPMVNDQQSVLLFLNQLRDNLGYGAKEVTTGGRAIKFYSHSRVFLKAPKADQRKDKRGNVIGQTVQAKIVKNRATVPYKEVEVELLFGKGIDKYLEILKLGSELGVIEKGGSWYSYGAEKLGQGQELVCSLLESNVELYEEIKGKVLDLYV